MAYKKQFEGRLAFLSNMFEFIAPILWCDNRYHSVENAYQASKTNIQSEIDAIIYATPYQAKQLGRRVTLMSDHHSKRLIIMTDLITQKFVNNPDLMHLLQLTPNIDITEINSWGDTYWGVCKDKGTDHLGRILKQIKADHAKEAHNG